MILESHLPPDTVCFWRGTSIVNFNFRSPVGVQFQDLGGATFNGRMWFQGFVERRDQEQMFFSCQILIKKEQNEILLSSLDQTPQMGELTFVGILTLFYLLPIFIRCSLWIPEWVRYTSRSHGGHQKLYKRKNIFSSAFYNECLAETPFCLEYFIYR